MSMTKPLVAPIVNVNGTSKEELVKQQTDVLKALRDVQTAMGIAMPHGRDYQTSRTAFADIEARKAWNERRMMIATLIEEIEGHAFRIDQQGRVYAS